ncbi:MAG: hypothetical protein V1866_01230 [archaeon]
MQKNPYSKFFFEPSDLPLNQFTHSFGQICAWMKDERYRSAWATFDLYVREMPKNRNFLVFAGLEELVVHIKNLRFTKKDIALLKRYGIIDKDAERFLLDFKFSGNIYSMAEGDIFFPKEPIIIVEGPLLEVSLLEVYMMNLAAAYIPYTSKAARIKLAAGDLITAVGGGLRSFSFSDLRIDRAGSFYGDGNALVYLSIGAKVHDKKFMDSIKPVVNAQHFFISSYKDELTAMRAMTKTNFAKKIGISFMVDTYDFDQGLENTITVGKEAAKKGIKLAGIYIDSQPLYENTLKARKRLNEEGFKDAVIKVCSNMDEYYIDDIMKRKPSIATCEPILLVSATQFVQLRDSPEIEAVFKISELDFEDGEKIYGIKLSRGKEHYPAKKQVFRTFDRNGNILGDIIGLHDEPVEGTPLLKQVVKRGRVTAKIPAVDEVRPYAEKQLGILTMKMKELRKQHPSPVSYSKGLQELFNKVKEERLKKYSS